MKIISIKKEKKRAISEAVKVLQSGGLIIYPTETCYGLGADATSQVAVKKLLDYKTFRDDKPISIAVCDKLMAKKYVTLNPTANNIYKEYLPGPFTVVSKSKGKVAKGVESNTKTLGVRIPDYAFVLDLVRMLKKPITATSANVSYKKSPYSLNDVLENTTKKQQDLIDLFLDAGELPKREPSTVIDTTLDDVNVLRQGDIILHQKHSIVTKSVDETREFGKKLVRNNTSQKDSRPVIIALEGELGTGKTQICKGIAQELGVTEEVLSPTFVICREYKLNKYFFSLQHLDIYKLFSAEELNDIGFNEMLLKKNIIVIEWAEKASSVIKELKGKVKIIWINLKHRSENERAIEYGEYV